MFLLSCLVMGCATRGTVAVTRGEPSSLGEVRTVELKCDPQVHYEWFGEKDLKDVLLSKIARKLEGSGIIISAEQPDLTLIIQQINTADELIYIEITTVVVLGVRDGQAVFKIVYSQHADSLSWGAIVRPTKDPNQVADVLANRIIREIRQRR